MKVAIERIGARIDDLKSFDPQSITSSTGPEVQELQQRIRSTLSQVFGEDTYEFTHLREACHLDRTIYVMSVWGNEDGGTSVGEIREGVNEGRKRAIALLQAQVDSLREALKYVAVPTSSAPAARIAG
jgi:hypothetical protein